MVYSITYSASLPSAPAITTNKAKRALEIARNIALRGHAPIIEHEGQKFTLDEFEAAWEESGAAMMPEDPAAKKL